MLRIAICDDEIMAREALRFALEKVMQEPRESIVYEFSSGESAAKWIKNHPGEIDLLFLDVEMKGMNGMEAATEIRKSDAHIKLVFVTGFTDYVFQGYQVDALDYIVKPASKEQIKVLLERVRVLMGQDDKECFVFRNTEGTYRMALSQICYFYSEKRLVYLVTKEREYGFYEKLTTIETQLEERFIRIHQRYLVNPKHVTFMGTETVSIGKIHLPISRSLKENAMRKLAMHLVED